MKYSDTGFRAVYRRFCTFPLTNRLRAAMEGFPKANDGTTCVITYGYVDQEMGLTLEIIAAGVRVGRNQPLRVGEKQPISVG